MAGTPLFNLRLDSTLRARVRAAALLRGVSESEIVRDLVRRARPVDLVTPSLAQLGAEAPPEAEASTQRAATAA